MKKSKSFIIGIIILLLIIVGGVGWLIYPYVEVEKPVVKFNHELIAIGSQTVFEIIFADSQSGLRSTTVTITQNNKTSVISIVNYPQRGTKQQILPLTINPAGLKLQDGIATLTISALDYSLFKNQVSVSRQINIDLAPPQVYLLNPINNINPGGTCVLVYQTSEPVSISGVEVNSYLFHGYPINVAGKPCIITYFALPNDAKKSATNIKVVARDRAGNQSSIAPHSLIRDKKFRSDKMNLTEGFLQQKMPEFQNMNPELKNKSLLDVFIYVNEQMRNDDFKKIQTTCLKSSSQQLWQDTFLRMKNGAPMALFGDKRDYIYDGKKVGESIHMGVDLASTEHAAIEAANHGIVVFTGNLGIYGNAVIIDHGLGVFSLYGHMSAIKVQKGQQLRKGDVMGNSGMSGLAGGDHLHFSVIVGGQFVNPQEWWDPHWIADNVNKKMRVSF